MSSHRFGVMKLYLATAGGLAARSVASWERHDVAGARRGRSRGGVPSDVVEEYLRKVLHGVVRAGDVGDRARAGGDALGVGLPRDALRGELGHEMGRRGLVGAGRVALVGGDAQV